MAELCTKQMLAILNGIDAAVKKSISARIQLQT